MGFGKSGHAKMHAPRQVCVCVFAMLEKPDCHIDCPLCVKMRTGKIRQKRDVKDCSGRRESDSLFQLKFTTMPKNTIKIDIMIFIIYRIYSRLNFSIDEDYFFKYTKKLIVFKSYNSFRRINYMIHNINRKKTI